MAQEESLSPEKMDEALFLFLVKMLSEQAWMSLGRIVNPVTEKQQKDLEQARTFIDLLGVLETRTKGNLTKDEEAFLKQNLTSLRLTFVEDKKDGQKAPSVEPAPTAAEESTDDGKSKGDKDKQARVVEEDEDGHAKVVDKRSSTADKSD